MSLENKVRIIPFRKDKAAMSLAIDRVLLRDMENKIKDGKNPEPIVRVYQFSNPTVIMGYNQKTEGRFNKHLAERMGVDLTVRDTGGGHVFFDIEDIHFSIFVPPNMFPDISRTDIYKNYAEVNTIIAEAMKKVGYSVALGRTSLRLNSGDGRIIAVTARREGIESSLHQGSILIEPYTDYTLRILMADKDETKLIYDKVAFLKNLNLNYNKIPNQIEDMFKPSYYKDLTRREKKDAEELYYDHYSNLEIINSGKKYGNVCLISGEKSTKDKEQEGSL